MKASHLLCLVALTGLPAAAYAAKQCEKDASGEVSCEQVSEAEPSQPGAVRESDDDSDEQVPSNAEREDDAAVGDRTSQSREPGITY